MRSSSFNLYSLIALIVIVMFTIPLAMAESDTGINTDSDSIDWIISPILVAASISAIITVFINFMNGMSNKKKVTIDFLLNMRTNPVLLDNQESFRRLVASETLPRILDPQTEQDFKDKLSAQALLNTFELVSIAIRKEVLNEDICKEAIGDTLTKYWANANEIVCKLREQDKNNTYFTEFELVANAWESGTTACTKQSFLIKCKKLINALSKRLGFKA